MFKTFYISPMLTTRENPRATVQKNTRNKAKHIDTKRHQNTKKDMRIRNKTPDQ